ncbi:class I adenylate-forming enzyme family protein [Desulfogranum mediterraneum]|uniref:class I adenylate-forming enzyme family protein n=1 Tax=Desulfogranum mediterraneum TaxID=160661 RepID=UPI00041CC154|nr:fatty acid--CoA ligase family protein [Desulfogranum mediterraneum]
MKTNRDTTIDTTIEAISPGIRATVARLLGEPGQPEKPFIHGGCTLQEVHGLAARFRQALEPVGTEAPLCLASEDKGVLAAALLAALAGGPTLLLPHALSAPALERLDQAVELAAVLGEQAAGFSPDLRRIDHQLKGSPSSGAGLAGAVPAAPGELLLQLFTGGTTGAPQLWSKSVANLLAEALFLADHFQVGEEDLILATIPPYHIYGLLFSVLLPLVSGARVVAESPSFPGEIEELVRSRGVSIMAAVPAHYRVLRGRTLPLRLAFSSAGMLDPADNSAFCRANTMGVIEVYGSTETGGIATRNRWAGEEGFTPFPTVEWQIHREQLAVRSPYISPDLPRDEAGFFHTSDRVEACGARGFLLKGRSDQVVKVGGKRVDLEEVRQLILEVAGVEECLVRALPEGGGRQHLIAALVQVRGVDPGRDPGLDPSFLQGFLEERLEPAARPRRLLIVEQIPLQANGKYDGQAITRLLQQ